MSIPNILERFKNIKSFIFDIDGVFTNGHLFMGSGSEILRTMNIRDGYALQLLITSGYKVAVISGGNATNIQVRLEQLGVRDIYLRCADKKTKLLEWCEANRVNLEECLYMGDDMPDLDAMKIVGLPTCPNNSATEIQQVSVYISPYNGGEGCVRDVIEKVLKLNNHWQ